MNGLSALTTIGVSGGVESGGGMWIDGNASLTSLAGLGSLTWYGREFLNVTDNGALPTCEATSLAAFVTSLGWTGTPSIMGNNDAGVCP